MKWILLSLVFNSFVCSANTEKIYLELNEGMTLRFPHLKRIAVTNDKVIKARAAPPHEVYLSANDIGKAQVTLWNEKGEQKILKVEVISSHLKDTFLKKETQTVVKVALQFLEVSRLRSESLGIKWPQAEIISSSGAVHIGQQGESGFSGLNYAVNFGTSKTLIQHLITEGAAKIVAAPNLFVRLGENATFHSGGEIPVSSASEGYGRIHRKVDWKPYGLTVKVKPESADGLHLSSEVRVEISEVTSSAAIDGLPTFSSRSLETKMDSKDGETVVLSGLSRQISHHEKDKVPGLSLIPVVGVLFSARSDREEEADLLMTMTLNFSRGEKEDAKSMGGPFSETNSVF